jgi:hypothetical protein
MFMYLKLNYKEHTFVTKIRTCPQFNLMAHTALWVVDSSETFDIPHTATRIYNAEQQRWPTQQNIRDIS